MSPEPDVKSMPMISRRRFNASLLSGIALGAGALRAQGAEKIKLLLITGQNNHDWRRTSPMLSSMLTDTGRFDVTVTTTPLPKATPSDWNAWRPDFSQYQALVLDYNGEDWPAPVKQSFEAYVRGGGGVLNIHAANNPFTGWTAFEEMTGLLWRPKTAGPSIYLDENGKPVTIPAGEGSDASHGERHDFVVTMRDAEHPIAAGIPVRWMHGFDELYHAQRGPAKNLHILASAYSDPAKKGTGRHELVLWWIPYGKGRVVTFLLGHLWEGQKELDALRCVGFRTIVQRAAEWAAVQKVTIPVPGNFPTEQKKSLAGA